MIPEALVAHEIPGRMRMRIPSRRGDQQFFSVLKERLSGLHGIERIETNSLTGSLLLFHHVEKDALAAYASENALFVLQPSSLRADPLSEKVVRSFQQIDRHLSSSTGGELDLPSFAFLVLLGVGTYQIIRGNFMAPAWYTAFWYASSVITSAPSRCSSEGT
jgi:hypothetical protein